MGSKQQPSMQDYTQLRYLTRCVCESMRLYPHPPVLLRRASIPDTLPGQSHDFIICADSVPPVKFSHPYRMHMKTS